MKAVVFHDIGDIRLDDVEKPRIQQPTDAIVRITTSAICGTDLHMIRGTLAGMKPGTILGHEAVGIVEELGSQVRNLKKGDRVVIPSTIACGYCSYCRAGYFAQCDNANPNGPRAGTAFFGGPQDTGPFDGLQAEYARIPFANIGPVALPDDMPDEEAIMISDILPTGYFGADIAEIHDGDTVVVFGCGPVGQCAILSSMLMGAGRVIAVDHLPSRLEMARDLGAEIVNFDEEEPVQTILDLTGGIGADRAIDAVGVDAEPPGSGPATEKTDSMRQEFEQEVRETAPNAHPHGDLWKPGQAPSLVLSWAVQSLAKAGTLAVIGVYPQQFKHFPIGMAMNMNLTVNAGNCNHRKYIHTLINLVHSGTMDPVMILTQGEPLENVLQAYEAFDRHESGWMKVQLEVA